MKDKPIPIINLLKEISKSTFTDPKAKQILEYCLENVQVFYKPTMKDAMDGNKLSKKEGADLL